MSETKETRTERLVYAGRRIDASSRKLVREWYDPSDPDHQVVFGKVKGGVIGGIYALEAGRNADGHISSAVPATSAYTGERYDDADQVARWEAADLVAARRDTARLVEARAAKDSELDKALARVQRIMDGQRSYREAEAFANAVKYRLIDRWQVKR